jgi:chemosensory pili system protein ChpC
LNASVDDFYGLLVPLQAERLVIPRGCVAEVLAWQSPTPMVGAPAWYMGSVLWNGRVVPLITFEATLGQSAPAPSGRTRIVVIRSLGTLLSAGHFAVMAQGFPQLVRLTTEAVTTDARRSFPDWSPVLAAIQVLNEPALIPDLEYLERLISEETSAYV